MSPSVKCTVETFCSRSICKISRPDIIQNTFTYKWYVHEESLRCLHNPVYCHFEYTACNTRNDRIKHRNVSNKNITKSKRMSGQRTNQPLQHVLSIGTLLYTYIVARCYQEIVKVESVPENLFSMFFPLFARVLCEHECVLTWSYLFKISSVIWAPLLTPYWNHSVGAALLSQDLLFFIYSCSIFRFCIIEEKV